MADTQHEQAIPPSYPFVTESPGERIELIDSSGFSITPEADQLPFDVPHAEMPTWQLQGTTELGRLTVEYTFETLDPEQPQKHLFTVFSGFGGIKLSSGPFSHAMALQGNSTLTIESLRKDDRSVVERLTNPHKLQIEAMSAAVEDLCNQTGMIIGAGYDETKLVPLGHSMGGEPALRFAEQEHTHTAAVLLLATIGFGSPNIPTLATKVPAGIVPGLREEVLPFLAQKDVPKTAAAVAKAFGYFALNPARTAGEALSCLTSDQKERAWRLCHELGVAVIYGQPVFDVLVQGLDGAKDVVSSSGEIERAGHMFMQAKPARCAQWVSDAMNAMGFADKAA